MSRANRNQVLETVNILKKANQLLAKLMKQRKKEDILNLLTECQSCAIEIGNQIDLLWNTTQNCIPALEEYCETVYQLSITMDEIREWENHYRSSRRQLETFEEAFEREVPDKIEVVFMPYKASMWDSLESIWMAAEEDEQCEALVVPIPYYERNQDGSLGKYHYEGELLPEYVPVTHYDTYPLAVRRPDVVYIHNPYDQANHVTSVAPRFYSSEIKKYTQKLVYVPYYTTSGGMSKAQELCPAYLNADYIVIQAEKYRSFFHPMLPDEKFLPLGSPKFDRVIKMCQNPPAPPIEWQKRMQGKKVYFYNTSINGMLADTRSFLLKMEYVFKTFQGREDVCLLWRPHPLLESTFDSMRKEYKPFYEELKRFFIQNELGIYDDTPDMTEAIAQCDAYIGDAASSVVSLFGIVGKPIFILNNNIHSLPGPEDWRGEIIKPFFTYTQDEWMITQGNKLYYAPNHDYKYEYYCNLSEDAGGDYYCQAYEMDGRIYVCPKNVQHILVIENKTIVRKIELEQCDARKALFSEAIKIKQYLFLISAAYSDIVRLDMKTEKLDYVKVHQDFLPQQVQGLKRMSGHAVWKEYLVRTSPIENKVLLIHNVSLEVKTVEIETSSKGGWICVVPNEDVLCLLPYEGTKITCYNMMTNKAREYDAGINGFTCVNLMHHYECMDRPFLSAVFDENRMILAPGWGNMFIEVDIVTGKAEQWQVPVDTEMKIDNGYFKTTGTSVIYQKNGVRKSENCNCFYFPERKLYEINMRTNTWKEIEIFFNWEELKEHEPGFSRYSEWLRYGDNENAFTTLQDFVDGNIVGHAFDRKKQISAYKEIIADGDGNCGKKVHKFISEQL